MEPGSKLALARKYHSPALRQRDLAQLLGVDTSTVGRWESTNHIPRQHLPKIAALLNVREEWFFDGGNTPPTVARRVPAYEPPNVEPLSGKEEVKPYNLIASGHMVALPVVRGAYCGAEEECGFVEPDEPELFEIPLFYTMGQPERHQIWVARGQSMSPRIEHAEKILMRLDPDVPPGCLVGAMRPDKVRFVKALVRSGPRLELHSVNGKFEPIANLTEWELIAGVTAIFHTYEPGRPNIEWDHGRYLRALV